MDWSASPEALLPMSMQKSFNDSYAAATGAFIVNRPTFLPQSGVVVGESKASSPKGKGLAGGGFSDGPPELVQMGGGATQVFPLGGPQADELIKPVASQMAGAAMNMMMMERVGAEGPGADRNPPIITDSSTTIVNNNNTTITPPQTRGQILPGQGRDHGVSHFTHAA